MKNTLRNVVLAGTLAACIAGCNPAPEKQDEYLVGTVKKEWGNLPGLLTSPGGLFANESVKINESRYVLQIEAEGKTYTAQVYHWGERSLEALSVAIEEGSKVRFLKTGYDDAGRPYERFSPDGIGNLRSTELFLE